MPDDEPLLLCVFLGNAETEDEEITEFLYDYASRFGEKFLLFLDLFDASWTKRGWKGCWGASAGQGGGALPM